MVSLQIIFKLFIIVLALEFIFSCETNQTRQGCRIHNGECLCGTGCYSEYRYSSKDECRKALKGRGGDSCLQNPCQHGGTCIQSSFEPGYRCRCEGTGYYGNHCQNVCPTNGAMAGADLFPYECIVI